MKQIQLYIEDQRIEMFKDESISLTETIQNLKDVGKIFTPFSKAFTVPASKNNSRVLKHFYNFNIVDGLDARVKLNSHIDLNYMRFHKGKIKLEGVQMKGNKPYAYKLTFFGDTVTLKDKIGNDKLDTLQWLWDFKFQYNNQNVINGLKNGIDITVDNVDYNNAFIVPLITHKARLFYDSTSPTQEENTHNLFHNGTTNGVDWQELKPAMRLSIIIKAIEIQYGINFSNDFFNEDNLVFEELYIWLHRKKGKIKENLVGDDIYTERVNFMGQSWGPSFYVGEGGFRFNNIQSYNNGWYYEQSVNYNDQSAPPLSASLYIADVNLFTNSTDEYTVIWKRDGVEIHRDEEVIGNYSKTKNLDSNGNYTFFIESTSSISFSVGHLNMTAYPVGNLPAKFKRFTIEPFSVLPNFNFDATLQLPEIKVIDLLSGIFKMFNLVCFLEYDGTVTVKTLDSWYAESTKIFDITSAIDTTSSSIDVALPYKEIVFDYEGKDSFFAKNHKALFNYDHGVEEYRAGVKKLSGKDYKIQLPFEHHKYERLYDNSTGVKTDVQWGWSVDDNMESILGKPLLFYPHRITEGTTISIKPTGNTYQIVDAFYIPSNSLYITEQEPSDNLNFKDEINEYTATQFPDTLFNKYYKNYIADTFDPKRRLTKFKAKLPMSYLLNKTLADRIIVFNNMYRINSIQTNFTTQISNIELINIQENLPDVANLQTFYVSMDSAEGQIDNSNYSIDTGSFYHNNDL